MKRCPECRRDYTDDTLSFCLDDGASLLDGPASDTQSEPGAIATGFRDDDEPATAIVSNFDITGEAPTRAQIDTSENTAILPGGIEAEPQEKLNNSAEIQSHSAHRAAGPRRLDKRLFVALVFLRLSF